MQVYAVCYDISDDHKRERVAKILLRYGHRVQFSVYEIMVHSNAELDSLCQKLIEVAEEEKRFRFYRVYENCRRVSQDLEGKPIMAMPAVIIV